MGEFEELKVVRKRLRVIYSAYGRLNEALRIIKAAHLGYVDLNISKFVDREILQTHDELIKGGCDETTMET